MSTVTLKCHACGSDFVRDGQTCDPYCKFEWVANNEVWVLIGACSENCFKKRQETLNSEYPNIKGKIVYLTRREWERGGT